MPVKAAVLESIKQIVIREFERPAIGPDDALIKVEMSGVCGTDPKIYSGKIDLYPLPLILGHETLGRVVEIGENAAQRYKVNIGDRVSVEACISCGTCRFCLEGNYRYCENEKGYGTKTSCAQYPYLWGSYSEYMYIAPGSFIHKVSDKVPAEAGVLANAVVANGIEWTAIGGVSLGDTVVIQGVGPQGLAAIAAAKERGAAYIIATGLKKDQARFMLAKKLGADIIIQVDEDDPEEVINDFTCGQKADVIIDVTGSPAAITKSLDLVKKMGTIVCGGLTGFETKTDLMIDKIVWNQIRFLGVFSKSSKSVEKAIKLIEKNKYPFEELVTHKFTLGNVEEALQLAGGEKIDNSYIKAVICPN